MADTESGTASEEVFRRVGYTEIGTVPRHGQSPAGQLKGRTFFYKELTPS
jgi:hypothetical protein